MKRSHLLGLMAVAALILTVGDAQGQAGRNPTPGTGDTSIQSEDGMVRLDFSDAELSVVIDTIARLTNKNFVYDDRVRGRVTVISPTKITIDQAYAVFESVLQVKGFTTVQGPGGALKIIPIREAKESGGIETGSGRLAPALRDKFVTRLIPLSYIDADAITNTLKPLVSKEASMVAYQPTNTIILTDSQSNIRRILSILDSIDIETHREELAVIKIEHADAATMAQQLSEIYGATVGAASPARAARSRARRSSGAATSPAATAAAQVAIHGSVRILTDDRTNSLIVLSSRSRLEDIRDLVSRLDVPVVGGGRIHVHYLKHADAEELSQTLGSLISGQPAGGGRAAGGGAAQAQALRAAVSELAEGITLTADPATNSLIIQASQEGYATLKQVIEQLDIPRPQVLIEALIMEVDVTDALDLGFQATLNLVRGGTNIALSSSNQSPSGQTISTISRITGIAGAATASGIPTLVSSGSVIGGIIDAQATNNRSNIISAPHILTSDNEEAEIRIGDNIPIITSRVESAAGQDNNLASSVNVERQDIGVTLRVTPQISEGDTLRLDIFQEITDINTGLTATVGSAENVGVPLSNRRIENTVVVENGETVVIGGLIKDAYSDNVAKIPWLGDIPWIGWLFKSSDVQLTKTNLLVFLTPHVMRSAADLEMESIRKREEFHRRSLEGLDLTEEQIQREEDRRKRAATVGIEYEPTSTTNPARSAIGRLEKRYPLERMLEIEREKDEQERIQEETRLAIISGPLYAVMADVFYTESDASQTLAQILDAGFDGTLVSGEAGDQVFYEIRLAPVESLNDAQQAADVMRNAFGLNPSILLIDREAQP